MANSYLIYIAVSILLTAGLAYMLFMMNKKIRLYSIDPKEHERIQERSAHLEKELKQKISEANQTNKELYKANILLNQEKDKSGAIIKYMADGIIVIDNDGLILEMNELALTMFDKPDKNIIGLPVKEIVTYPQYLDALEKVQTNIQDRIELEITIVRDDKTWKALNVKITKAIDKKGNPLGLISLIRDITKQKELDNLKNNFIRTISHELRTPLTSIIGFIDILKSEKRGPLTDDQKEYLEVIRKGSLHLRQLINDLLDISLMESKKLKMKFEQVDLASVFNEIALSFMPQIKLKNIELRFIDNPDLQKVYTDEDKARRIFINILNNAIKFTSTGYVQVSFSSSPNFINVHIEDTGIGIKHREKEIIFERFRQIDASSTRKYEGMGIGLTIVKDLLNLLGGSIEVSSEENKGSIFTFSLPINYAQGQEYNENA